MEKTSKTFNFHLDTKVTTWYRTKFEIEADTLEEAQKKAVEFCERGDDTELPWYQVDDTIEGMVPEENGNQPTQELFNEEANVIWNNMMI